MTELPANIPANLRPFIEELGVDLAITLFLELGGGVEYIAENPQRRGALVKIIGLDNARLLGRRLGRGPLRIPLANRFIARYLRYERGWTVKAIARRMHTSDVAVRRHAPERSQPQVQPDLFGD